MKILTDADVINCLSTKDAIESQRLAFTSDFDAPDRIVLQTVHGVTLFKPSTLKIPSPSTSPPTTTTPPSSSIAIKIVSVRPLNSSLTPPLATVPATILIIDDVTGAVDAVIAGTRLTALRTAGGSGCASLAMMAFNDVGDSTGRVLTVFGAGMQCEEHVKTMCYIDSNIDAVNIVNRSSERCLTLIEVLKVQLECENVKTWNVVLLNDVKKVEEAVRVSEVICLTTNSSIPLFSGTWLKPGCHINGVGSFLRTMREVDDVVLKRAVVIIDSDNARDVGDLYGNDDAVIVGDLKGVITGTCAFDRSKLLSLNTDVDGGKDVTFFKSVGLAVQDNAAGKMTLAIAKVKGIGIDVDL